MNKKSGAIQTADAFMDVGAASMKRKDRDYDEEQDTQYKKSRADVLATANTVIMPTTSDDVKRTTAGSSVSNNLRSVATYKNATASFTSPIITRARAREHDAALNHPATPSNKLKHRLEDYQEEESQDHDQEPWKRYKAQSKDGAPLTLSPSPTPSLMPSSSFDLSQTSSRRSSSRHCSSSYSARSTSQLPKSSSSAPSVHPSPASVDTKRTLPKPTLTTLRSATTSLRSSTPQSSSPTPFTIATSESVNTSSHGSDDSWVKVREIAETMIVTIQTRAKKATTKTRQEQEEPAQNREVERCISVTTLIVDPSKEHMGDAGSRPLVSITMNQGHDAELTKNSKRCYSSADGEAKEVDETKTHDDISEVLQLGQYNRVQKTAEILQTQEITEVKTVQKRLSSETNDQREDCVDSTSVRIRRGNATRTEHEHPVTQNVDETKIDFELDIRGTLKRNNYPLRDCLPRVAGIPPPNQFHLRTLTRLVSSAKPTSRNPTENLYSRHARLVDENITEVQLDPNHPWAQGSVEFITSRNRRHYHDEYRISDNCLGHNHFFQNYDNYSSQYNPSTYSHNSSSNSNRSRRSHPSTTARLGEINSALSFVHQAKRGRQSHHHSSNNDTANGCIHDNSNYSANPTHLHHLQNSTTKRYDTDENIPPPSYKAPTFDFPSKKRAEPVPLILSTSDRTSRTFSSSNNNRRSNNSSSGTNTNFRNHHPFGPNVIEGSDIQFSRCPHASGHYLL